MLARLMFLIGIILMIFAIVAMIFMTQGADNSTTARFFEAVACKSGEHVTEFKGAASYNPSTRTTGRSVTYYCENPAKEVKRDVTGRIVLAIVVTFTVPFVLGLLMFMFSIFWLTGRFTWNLVKMVMEQGNIRVRQGGIARQSYTTTPATVIYSSTGTVKDLSELPAEDAQKVQQVLGSLGLMMNQAFDGLDKGSLPDKLGQLKESLDKGLISPEEYERLRQQILDNMGDG